MIVRVKKCAIIFLAIVFFAGCVSTASLPNLRPDGEAAEKGKGEFVELNNGTIIDGDITKVSLATLLALKKVGNVTLNGTKYGYKEINAFQKEGKYYRKDAYNYFNERIVKGKINVYRSFHTGQSVNSKGMSHSFSYYLHYLQKGDTEKVVAFELKVLKKMIQDYEPAVEEFNKYDALSKKEKKFKGDNYLDNVIYTYNNRN
ncbi:hypothetical protein [Ferruginibacter sp.]|nr:hypothetical protein [Ferruginibacter sp.]